MPRLFDAYVIVRWSAASKAAAGADSVLIGLVRRDVRFRNTYSSQSAPTRAEGEKKLVALLEDLAKRNEKVLLALDFPLGFPRGLAEGLKLAGEPWRAVWNQLDKMVKDKVDNTNNRFGVASEINRRLTGGPFPFWGCPPRDALTTLQPKRTREHEAADLPELRLTETKVKGAPSIWKLYYNGSIGGQAILGVPMVRRLKVKYGDELKVWPFETGWGAPDLSGVRIVAAEVFTLGAETKPAAGETKDQTEIRAYAEQVAKLDEAGKLEPLFAQPKGVPAAEAEIAQTEEGWILGA
ncbi:MAG TPA: cobalamin biosynthesis protein CbiG [Caulobacteraceae bacterium]|nr:cobalamin biosynthesis protein CbiG [Caulobacteraceae bacterium]